MLLNPASFKKTSNIERVRFKVSVELESVTKYSQSPFLLLEACMLTSIIALIASVDLATSCVVSAALAEFVVPTIPAPSAMSENIPPNAQFFVLTPPLTVSNCCSEIFLSICFS